MHFIPPRNTVPGIVRVLTIFRVQRELRKEGELWVYIRLYEEGVDSSAEPRTGEISSV